MSVGRRDRTPANGESEAKTLRTSLPLEAPPRFETRVLPGTAELAEAAAREFQAAAGEAIAARGRFRVALSGGSTPRLLHQRLTRAPFRRGIDWKRIQFFFGDERCVPPDSDRSNYRMAAETLFAPLDVSEGQIHRIRGEAPPKKAAEEYRRVIDSEVAGEGGRRRFDMILLGLGPDGHTASLFPGTLALDEKDRSAVANWIPKLREWRITLTYPVLDAARRVIFLVSGEEKASPAAAIIGKKRAARELPAAGVRPRRGSLLWLLDEKAGSEL
ncbi:MAG: 6-phosphogluconolactonase [Acidobacteriota bacterium]|nr:6-phosphogluconolactonase [Acidobacteriota bacterium]